VGINSSEVGKVFVRVAPFDGDVLKVRGVIFFARGCFAYIALSTTIEGEILAIWSETATSQWGPVGS
jgi:hypothetical protein